MFENLRKTYGPLIGGPDLVRVLGYRSNAAFRRAEKLRIIGVRVFEIEGRKGKFALSHEVEEWLESLVRDSATDVKARKEESGRD